MMRYTVALMHVILLSIALLSGCGGGGGGDSTSTTAPESAPSVTSFTSDNSTVTASDSVRLTAVFDGTGSVDQGIGVVTSGTAVTVTPTATTTYTLTVSSAAGTSVTAQQTVTVIPAPVITSFVATADTITVGDSSNLAAVFTNGTGSVDQGVGAVSSGNSISVTPPATTTYTLTVTNAAGTSITAQATVNVIPAPVITSFSAGLNPITTGDNTTLTAVFANGSGSVDNGVGAVTSGGAVTVTPSNTTSYTLTVTNDAGRSITAQETVTVLPVTFSFMAYGDSRAGDDCSGNAVHTSLVDRMKDIPADFVVHLGDMVAGYNSNTNWISDGGCTDPGSRGSFRDIIAPLQNKTPPPGLPTYFIPVVGNHDDRWDVGWYPDPLGGGFCDVFDPVPLVPNHTQQSYFVGTTVPRYTNTDFYNLACSKTSDEVYPRYMYYSVDHKNTHLVVMRINDEIQNLEACNSCTDRSDYQDYYAIHQLDWLRADLAAASANPNVDNIIVFLHAPLFTTSDGNNANVSWQLLASEFTTYGVDMVFSGHNHVYERTVPISVTPIQPNGIRDDINGTVYVVTGGGGSPLYGFSANQWYMETSSSDYHYVKVDVVDSTINVTAIKPDGSVIDSFSF